MDFEKDEVVNEEEIDALGIKKKDDAEIDVDAIVDDSAIPPELQEEDDSKDSDKGIFGDDAELEQYMLSGYEENY